MSDFKGGNRADQPPTIVLVLAKIFYVLKFFSLLRLLKWIIPWLDDKKRSNGVTEIWVISHTVIALCAMFFAFGGVASILISILLIYGGLRIFNIVVTLVWPAPVFCTRGYESTVWVTGKGKRSGFRLCCCRSEAVGRTEAAAQPAAYSAGVR